MLQVRIPVIIPSMICFHREANPKKSKIMQEKYAPILSRSTFTWTPFLPLNGNQLAGVKFLVENTSEVAQDYASSGTCINWTPIVVCANHSLKYHLQVQCHLHVQKTTHHNNKHTIVRLQCTVHVHVD